MANSLCRHKFDKTPRIEFDALSHAVNLLTRRKNIKTLRINTHLLSRLEMGARIKNPQEQLDNLVIWLGDTQDPYMEREISREGLLAIVGAPINQNSLQSLVENAIVKSLIYGGDFDYYRPIGASIGMRLSLYGWERFSILRNVQSDSKIAFMAMKFDEPNVAQAFEQCFKPAAAAAGFTLAIATDIQKAGHIDDQMMVAIRTARFLVADTSDDNRGVYWEAGFAHGLGKPVFYTCLEDIFNDPNKKPHFDIDHMVTIKWNPENWDIARRELTAKIRNTFPIDAKLSDES